MQHVSFSALKNWNQCPYYYKITYVDKIKKFVGNHYTAFGTAVHEVCEKRIEDDSITNEPELFELAFSKRAKVSTRRSSLNIQTQRHFGYERAR